jgi:hypothetical protein
MMNLAMSQVMAGANFWDAPGHSMAGSNDLPSRTLSFFLAKGTPQPLHGIRNQDSVTFSLPPIATGAVFW